VLLASAEKSHVCSMCSVLHFAKLEGDTEIMLTARRMYLLS